MAEFIGARISLVSRSDIRYVGTLHEINSENSTVALENVTSFGTEGRKSNPDEEIPSSDSVYDYIVFRGSDVKDLRIEEAPAAKESKPPQVPNDPAILGSGSRPPPQTQAAPRQNQQGPSQQQQQQPPPGPSGPPNGPPFGQHPQYPPFYPPPPAGWGRGGPQGPQGPFQPMPYGAPPGWYPPPGQGFPQHGPGPFPPYGYPPPGQFLQGPPGQQQQQGKPAPIGPGAKQHSQAENEKLADSKTKPAEMAASSVQKAAAPSANTKQSPTEETPATQPATSSAQATQPKPAPSGPTRVQPAIPLTSPAATKTPLQSRTTNSAPSQAQPQATNLRDATQAATAAVAAAMAKLPPAGQTNGNAVDNLTRKVNEMRTNDPVRGPRVPGATGTGFVRGGRGGRGGASRNPQTGSKAEVPGTDFDFESSNAKFNKQDLVKEAIAGSPLGENPPAVSPDAETPVIAYNKASSFFDNIGSESRDRAEASNGTNKPGGREWRGEEQRRNVETFGQGSVDNGSRGGYRGRGRGRGRGFRGRGYSGGPRGGYRGSGETATQ